MAADSGHQEVHSKVSGLVHVTPTAAYTKLSKRTVEKNVIAQIMDFFIVSFIIIILKK